MMLPYCLESGLTGRRSVDVDKDTSNLGTRETVVTISSSILRIIDEDILAKLRIPPFSRYHVNVRLRSPNWVAYHESKRARVCSSIKSTSFDIGISLSRDVSHPNVTCNGIILIESRQLTILDDCYWPGALGL
jgi:hypothetical protein